MRIDSNQGAQPLPENQAVGSASASKAGASATPTVSSPLGEDQAQFPGVHFQVQALVAHVAQLPESTQEKIHALRQAIVSGKYRPSPSQIAGALFSSLVSKVAA